jgi:hypothetical protein
MCIVSRDIPIDVIYTLHIEDRAMHITFSKQTTISNSAHNFNPVILQTFQHTTHPTISNYNLTKELDG